MTEILSYHDLLDSQSVYNGLGVDRKMVCSHDSDVWGCFRGLLLATNCHAKKYVTMSCAPCRFSCARHVQSTHMHLHAVMRSCPVGKDTLIIRKITFHCFHSFRPRLTRNN
jgi:hypothetical protein